MNVFIVSHQPVDISTAEQIKMLATIDTVTTGAVPIVAVSDFYNLRDFCVAGDGSNKTDNEVAAFTFEDFRNGQSSVQDQFMIDGNLLAGKMNVTKASWIVVDIEQNLQITAEDFIKKLGRYTFLSESLKSRNLVLLVPPLFVGMYARLMNKGLNNLPVSRVEIAQSGQTNLLFLSSTMERFVLSMPLLTGPLRQVSKLMMHVYQRLVRPV